MNIVSFQTKVLQMSLLCESLKKLSTTTKESKIKMGIVRQLNLRTLSEPALPS